jgi:RNA recognition motif-containing protein
VKKLFVGNLSFKMLESDLQQVFASFGIVKEAKIITDRETARSRGFAFVTMENDADADKAITNLNGREIGGREIIVNEARERTSGGGGRGPGNNGHGGSRGSDRHYN